MANLINITDNVLSQNSFSFESSNVDIEKIPVPIENVKFGILNFTAITSSETNKEHDFVFVVDCSGSMSDICCDGISKMQHIIHTLKKMITFLHEHRSIHINITINAFDSQLYKIIERLQISSENIDELLYKIDQILPRGSTDIENALRKTAKYIQELKITYPSTVINHIFMTDGEASHGSTDVELLKTLVVLDVTNSFIGFGIHHDAGLLNGISSVGESSYHFIDKLESAGFVYGEILHSIIYNMFTDCKIELTNGLIYDFKTNCWVQSLKIGNIISEANKTYNIISEHPDEFRATIQGTSVHTGHTIKLDSNMQMVNDDLPKHVFRQRTLQLLFEVNEYCNKKREFRVSRGTAHNTYTEINQYKTFVENFKIKRDSLKQKLVTFMEDMKKFMTDNELTEDKFMKNLCDDIYICFRTFDTKYGNMYCTSRQSSQGSQRQYTVSDTFDVNQKDNHDTDLEYIHKNITQHRVRGGGGTSILRRRRETNADLFNFEEINLDYTSQLTINHVVSDFDNTPYLTPQATQVMRFVCATNQSDQTQEDKI